MTDRILALVDGSIYAKSVCEHAAWAAQRTGYPLELVHVIGRREAPERQDLSGAIALGARSVLLEELTALDEQRATLARAQGRAILDDARAIVGGAGIEATSSMRRGDLVETVAEREQDAAFILIGKRGEAADFARGHLGSNLERVVRAARKPVLVASRAFRPIQRVLIAYDCGASARRAVDHVVGSPLYAGLEIVLLTIGADSDQMRKGVREAQAILSSAGIEATARIIPGEPDEVIGKLVESESFDMVVMGAYGHSRVRTLIIGSTTSEMVRSCKVPIVMVR